MINYKEIDSVGKRILRNVVKTENSVFNIIPILFFFHIFILCFSVWIFVYFMLKGSDRQCMVVELRLQYCREIFSIYLSHKKRFKDL